MMRLNYLDMFELLGKMKYKYDKEKDLLILKFDQGKYDPKEIKKYVLADGNIQIQYLSEKKPLVIAIFDLQNTIKKPEIKELLGNIPPEVLTQVKNLFGGGNDAV